MSTDAEDVARAVLAKASANDPTMPRPDELVVMAWTEHMNGLTIADALQAVTAHYDTEARRIMPADVRKLAIKFANDRAERHRQDAMLREIAARPANPARARQLAAWCHAQFNAGRGIETDEAEETHRLSVLAAHCPWCHATAGEPCISLASKKPLRQSAFHEQREIAAKQATT